MFPSGEYDNELAMRALVKCIGDDRPVLFVGAGCSVDLGYPALSRLLSQMREHFGVSVPAGLDLLKQAQHIRTWLTEHSGIDDYHNYLEQTFGPKAGLPGHLRLHSALVRLPFCGCATTNYDYAIESALSDARGRTPVTIDFCRERRHKTFSYLRQLSTNSNPGLDVLHLHGCYNNPEQLVLTEQDYVRAYGREVEVKLLEGGKLTRNLDTPYRKVLWTLLVMHPVVFIGFSLDDPAFTYMLKVVQGDFRLGSDLVHLAIVPWKPSDDVRDLVGRFKGINVQPIFYEVRQDRGGTEYADHRALETLVLDVASTLKLDVPPLGLAGTLGRMIGLVRDED
jgi:hypothetical protein